MVYGFKEFLAVNPEDNEILELYLNHANMTVAEIARTVGKSQTEIYRILHYNNVTPNRLRNNHGKVISLSGLGWDVQKIAEFTGYTPRNVRYILAKHLNE